MKNKPKKIITQITISLGLLAIASATEVSDYNLLEWKLGPTLFGEKISEQDMKGKIVVIGHWGVECDSCFAALPHLVKLDRRHRKDGLLIIGAESQQHPKGQIEPLVKKHKIEYTITAGASGPIQFSGIPQAFVFNVRGKLIFHGNPNQVGFERAIKTALKEVKSNEDERKAVTSNLFETRAWTNADGKEMKAAVKEATEKAVIFVMAGGRFVTYPMEKLSEVSRKLIREALAARERPAL